jgi:hypothetical protein
MPFWPPQLTEAWGAAYLHIIIILLVFAYGIPFLLLQILVSEEIKRIIAHYRKEWFIVLLAILTAFIAVIFIWFLHPCSNGLAQSWQHWASAILVTIIIGLTVFCWLRYVGLLSTVKVARFLGKKLQKSARKNKMTKEEISDLISLGEKATSGYEKNIVLQVLEKPILTAIMAKKNNLGDVLAQFLRDIHRILVNKEKPGNDDNYYTATEIIGNIISKFEGQSSPLNYYVTMAYLAFERLAAAAIEANYDTIVQCIVQKTRDSRTLFQIGLSALNSRRFFMAVVALNKLEAIALENVVISADKSVYLLGMLAHFWNYDVTSKSRAKQFLNTYRNQFSPSLRRNVNIATEHFKMAPDYDTADKLVLMRSKI